MNGSSKVPSLDHYSKRRTPGPFHSHSRKPTDCFQMKLFSPGGKNGQLSPNNPVTPSNGQNDGAAECELSTQEKSSTHAVTCLPDSQFVVPSEASFQSPISRTRRPVRTCVSASLEIRKPSEDHHSSGQAHGQSPGEASAGCKCQKSRCLKLYCDCFKFQVSRTRR